MTEGRERRSAGTPATVVLARAGVAHELLPYRHMAPIGKPGT